MWFLDSRYLEGHLHPSIGRITPDGMIAEFDEGLGQYSWPSDIVAGPDGNLWLADYGNGLNHGAIGRITPNGTTTEFSTGVGSSRPTLIINGPGGDLWFTAGGSTLAIGKATITGAISEFALPSPPRVPVVGSDGNVWFTYGAAKVEGAIGQVVEEEGGTTTITLFRQGLAAGSRPRSIVLGADGNLWFADDREGTGAIGRVTPTGQIEEFDAGLREGSRPERFVLGPDGNIWFIDDPVGAIGRITPDGTITEFSGTSLKPNQGLRDIVAGPDGNLWFTHGDVGGAPPTIGKISTTGAITLLNTETSRLAYDASPDEIVSGPEGMLWFDDLESTDAAIGRIIPGDDSPPQEPSTREPAPSGPNPTPTGTVALASSAVAVRKDGKVVFTLQCTGTSPCVGELSLAAKRIAPKGARMQTIGRATFSIRPGATVSIKVRINRVGQTLLRVHHGHLGARLTIVKTYPRPASLLRRKVRLVQSVAGKVKRREAAQVARRGSYRSDLTFRYKAGRSVGSRAEYVQVAP